MRIVAFLTLLLLFAPAARGQSLAERYNTALFRAQAERIFAERGLRATLKPPAHVLSPSDSVRAWIARFNPEVAPFTEPEPAVPAFVVDKWKLVRKLERPWFEKQFESTLWAYVGSNRITPLDTMFTRELRARLEARFGSPTRTLTEVDFHDNLRKEEYIEFEYWFVLNDSIPLIVMDVNGPFERGLVVAGDQRFRDHLLDIKHAFLEELVRSGERAPYVDYYYHTERGLWFRTGFDGQRYFLTQISRPNLARGRPYLPDDSSDRTSTNK